MRLSTCVKRLRESAEERLQSTAAFGAEIGVSHTAIVEWENGKGISPFNRMRLLAYAKRVNAAPEIIDTLEAAQPEMRP